MKREGRQHGVVTSSHIPPAALSRRRFIKMVDSSAVAGIFTRVPAKPTNQSKFTGKCRRPRCNGCHIHPACKSKDKAKGTMKLRSIDAGKELTKYFSGSSVTGVLAYLADESGYDDGHTYDDDDHDYEYNYANYSYDHAYDDHDYDHHDEHEDDDDDSHEIDLGVGFGIGIEEHENDVDVGEIDVDDDDDEIDVDDDDDDAMSFCDVGLSWGHGDGDDDGWYLVGEEMY